MTSKKGNKTKIVWVDGTPVTPVTAAERKRIGRSINKKYAKLRRKYKELHGRKVDWISHAIEDDSLYFTVRFKDKTALHLQVRPELVIEGIELSDWSTGDDKILRTYFRRRNGN
jgi:hypothetical protein